MAGKRVFLSNYFFFIYIYIRVLFLFNFVVVFFVWIVCFQLFAGKYDDSKHDGFGKFNSASWS